MAAKRVIIVGGGFAGLQVAKHLGSVPGIEVTLLDRSNHHLFQPMLYQVATAALSPAEITRPIRSILAKHRNVTVLQTKVTGVDLAMRCVSAKHAAWPYDYLVMAAGAENSYFGRDDWRRLATGLKTVRDAIDIRNRLLTAFEAAEREDNAERKRHLLTFCIVGGGYTGVELAGAVAELAHYTLKRDFRHIDPVLARVILLEAGPQVLPTMPESLSRYADGVLKSLAVDVRTNLLVTDISSEAVSTNQQSIGCATVLWAAGTKPSSLADWLTVPKDQQGRIFVEPDLSLAGHPEVFVLGDMAHCAQNNGHPLPAIAPVAFQQGHHVGRLIQGELRGKSRKPFRYWNKGELAAIGRNRAVGLVGGHPISGRFAWLAWVFVHIYYLTGFRNRLIVMLQWAWTYLADSRGARLIVGDGEKREGEDAV